MIDILSILLALAFAWCCVLLIEAEEAGLIDK